MQIKTAFLTDPGGRAVNDDSVQIHQEENRAWVYVADGLGGYAGGQLASRIAGEVLMRAGCSKNLLNETSLRSAIETADMSVRQLQQERHASMKTTVTFLVIEHGAARWAHVGDSRVYHFHNHTLQSQTTDHSVSQMAVLLGEITASQIRFHPDRNRVLRALGSPVAKPDLSPSLKLTEGEDVFLLCTDGFWEYVYEKEMVQTLRDSDTPIQWLRKMEKVLLSRAPADHDNYSAAAVFY